MSRDLTGVITLADLYNADLRVRDADVWHAAAAINVPHPLRGVLYADGLVPCTHARRHRPGACPSPIDTTCIAR